MNTTEGTEWEVLVVSKITDGDTVRLVRQRLIDVDGRTYWLQDGPGLRGVPIRLAWLDTPERGMHPGWENARDDLTHWVDQAPGPLRLVCYASAGWDRLLGDLIDATGRSASQWMMTERGWPPYTGRK